LLKIFFRKSKGIRAVRETWSFKIIFVTPHALDLCESFLLENRKVGDFGDKKRRCFALEV